MQGSLWREGRGASDTAHKRSWGRKEPRRATRPWRGPGGDGEQPFGSGGRKEGQGIQQEGFRVLKSLSQRLNTWKPIFIGLKSK